MNSFESFFKDKVVWITGASSGIGEALTYQLSYPNTKLIISARRTQELELVKEKCKYPDNVIVLPMDLEKIDEINQKVEQAKSFFGKIDILINNAGIGQRALAEDTPLEIDKKIMEINYFGTLALTKAVMPEMINRKSGKLVVVTSLVGVYGTPERSAYAASKHALHGFFDSLRAEIHKYNISVNIVCPGVIKTDIAMKALTGSGTPNGKEAVIPKGVGLSSEDFAYKMVKAIVKNKNEVYIGGPEVVSIYIKKFIPVLFAKIIRSVRVT